MKIMILVPDSGPKGARNRGDVVEVSKKEAMSLIKAGRAQPERDDGQGETATAQTNAETASAAKAAAKPAAAPVTAKTAD